MGLVKLSVLIAIVASIGIMENQVTASENATTPTVDAGNLADVLDKSIGYVYEMTRVFLEDVVQQKYLTEVQHVGDLSSLSSATGSFAKNWQTWTVHYIGFAVCFALGIVLFVVMLLACFIFPCCRCCGRCGAPNPDRQKGVARGCKIGCSLALIVVAVGLILGAVGMFVTNETMKDQLDGALFEKVGSALDGVRSYLERTFEELVGVVYDQFRVTMNGVLAIIGDVQRGAIKAIDDSTGVVTTLNQLNNFSSQLEMLQVHLMRSESLAADLDAKAKQLDVDLSVIASNVTSALSGCYSAECNRTSIEVRGAKVAVDFSVVNVTAAIAAVNLSLAVGLKDMVDKSLQHIRDIETSIKATMLPNVDNVLTAARSVESQLSDLLDRLKSTLNGIEFNSIQKTVNDFRDKDAYKMAVDITYGVFLGLSCVVSLVIIFDLLGLLFGWILPPDRHADSAGCRCTKAVGYHLLTTGTAVTLIFYWLFSLLVAILFVSGGLVQTELCRNIINFDEPGSAAVLSIYDDWTSGLFGSDLKIRPFKTYSDCHLDKPIYDAFDVASVFNISEIADKSAEIKETTETFKGQTFNLPPVNFSDPNFIYVLRVLDEDLSESALNFTHFYANIDGNLTDPYLPLLAAKLDSLKDVNLTGFSADLRTLYLSKVVPMSSERNRLLDSLHAAESVVRLVSFGSAADVLVQSETIINENGSYIVSGFVNDTADAVYRAVDQYLNATTAALEGDVGKCRPLYRSLKTVFDGFCKQFLYSLNGYWYCLGWNMFFLIPNLFVSVKLASVFKLGTSVNTVKHQDHKE